MNRIIKLRYLCLLLSICLGLSAPLAARAEPEAGNGATATVRVDLRPSPRSPKRLVVHAGEVVGLAGLDGHRVIDLADIPGLRAHPNIAYQGLCW